MKRGSALRCVAALALAGVVAACTTSGHAVQAATSPSRIPQSTPAPVPSTSDSTSPESLTATTSPPATSSTPPSSSASPTPTPTPSPTPTVPQSTCTSISVRVLPGGASFGEQIAGLQFTNTGSRPCLLAGYPTVTLLLHGRMIGRPSEPSSQAISARWLKPGEVAESLLHDYTQTCQAPLSDSVRVQVPGEQMTAIRPDMQLRACVLRVDRLGAPD